MYLNEISKKLDEIDDVIIKDDHPTINELMQIRKVIWEGLLLCNKLYKKSGSVEKAIKLYFETRMNMEGIIEYNGDDCIISNLPIAMIIQEEIIRI